MFFHKILRVSVFNNSPYREQRAKNEIQRMTLHDAEDAIEWMAVNEFFDQGYAGEVASRLEDKLAIEVADEDERSFERIMAKAAGNLDHRRSESA